MNRKIIATGAATLLVAGLSFGIAAPATADVTSSTSACIPSDASTVVTIIPAVGEPTIQIPNPDYVPAVDTIPAQPAVGEPTIEIPNPDYVAPTYVAGYWKDVPASYTPAVGTPTITVTKPNPDYVPAVAEIPEVSHTDYVAKRYVVDVQHQDAVTKTQWRYVKNGGYGEVWLDSNAEHKVKINGYWYERTSKTRTVEVSPEVAEQGHWDEQTFHERPGAEWTILSESKHVTQAYVAGSPAQGSETIDVQEANPNYVPAKYTPATKVWVPPVYTPAVGTKTIVVDNPDYVPATEEIPGTPAVGEETLTVVNPGYTPEREEITEIPAVECPVVPTTPTTPEKPEPLPAANPVQIQRAAAVTQSDDTLAQTGLNALEVGTAVGAGLVLTLGGGAALLASRRARRSAAE